MKKLIPIIILSIFFVFSYGAKKEIEKYPNGNMKSEVKLNKDGLKHGKYKSYYDNGKNQSKGKYKNGKKVGKLTFYYEDGSIKKVEEYKDGELVK